MRYLFLGILVFIGLALIARVDILDKKGFWETEEKLVYSPFSIYQPSGALFWEIENGLSYAKNQLQPVQGELVATGLDSLSNYLKTHNEKMLLLCGSFQPAEQSTQVAQFASLGRARAFWLSQEMTARGISRSRFVFRDSLLTNSLPNFAELQIIEQ